VGGITEPCDGSWHVRAVSHTTLRRWRVLDGIIEAALGAAALVGWFALSVAIAALLLAGILDGMPGLLAVLDGARDDARLRRALG
jgi:hypothetical protein